MANRHEMEEQIAQLKRDLEQAVLEGETLRAKLEVYTGKEQAMAQALTEATASASRIRAAAQEEVKNMQADARSAVEQARSEADQLHKQAFQDAEKILNEAASKANAIIAAAKNEAEARLSKANQAVAQGEARLQKLNTLLSDMAQQTRSQAYSLNLTAADHSYDTSQAAAPIASAPQPKLPDEYATPAALMHGIYQLQGRDTLAKEAAVPAEAAEKASESAPIEPTLFAPPAHDDPSPALECVDTAEDIRSQVEQIQAEEARLWTVDEIMAQAEKEETDTSASSELDDLLNEILKD